jgi:hypothetical protein
MARCRRPRQHACSLPALRHCRGAYRRAARLSRPEYVPTSARERCAIAAMCHVMARQLASSAMCHVMARQLASSSVSAPQLSRKSRRKSYRIASLRLASLVILVYVDRAFLLLAATHAPLPSSSCTNLAPPMRLLRSLRSLRRHRPRQSGTNIHIIQYVHLISRTLD